VTHRAVASCFRLSTVGAIKRLSPDPELGEGNGLFIIFTIVTAFPHLPLGQPIPASPHAVSCSLPTMRDVRGYEEKDPAVTKHLTSGYPRFVVHPFLRQLAALLVQKLSLPGQTLWLTTSAPMADALAAHLGVGQGTHVRDGGVHGVAHAESPELYARAKTFLQNIGGFLSSREAEDELVRRGALRSIYPEETFSGDATAEIRRHLRRAMPAASDTDLLLAPSGMNAIYASFRAIADLQAARGRTVWVQLGWLYLDTIAILKKFTATPDDYLYVGDVFDAKGLEELFATHGARIAGVVAEVPTNPLIQTPNVAALAALCRQHGARLVLDPSVSSAFNLDLLAHADVVTCSLTKYTAAEGDLTAGLAAINPAGPDAATLRTRIAAAIEPLYPRDRARLAWQINQTDQVLAQIHANTPRVVAFLATHPAVREVFWALHPESRDNYLNLTHAPDATGGMISFSLRTPLEPFYNRLRLPKGPSFGMKTTLICPFMYLAHYDLVTTPAGRAELAASGIDPDLLRLCVGIEPAEEIIAALAEALG
jgi:cystathionine gamma-synthase